MAANIESLRTVLVAVFVEKGHPCLKDSNVTFKCYSQHRICIWTTKKKGTRTPWIYR